jgi:hypothetical protein
MRHLALALLLTPLLPLDAHAGPPCICWRIEIGEAKSLPWGEGSFERSADYDARGLVADTLALLGPGTPVLVRMETLRRAAIYAESDGVLRDRLLLALTLRVADASAREAPGALALFDAGYALTCFRQLGSRRPSDAPGAVDGLAWLRRAGALRPGDPAVHFALALAGVDTGEADLESHVRQAQAGAREDPLLARNLAMLARNVPDVRRILETVSK